MRRGMRQEARRGARHEKRVQDDEWREKRCSGLIVSGPLPGALQLLREGTHGEKRRGH